MEFLFLVSFILLFAFNLVEWGQGQMLIFKYHSEFSTNTWWLYDQNFSFFSLVYCYSLQIISPGFTISNKTVYSTSIILLKQHLWSQKVQSTGNVAPGGGAQDDTRGSYNSTVWGPLVKSTETASVMVWTRRVILADTEKCHVYLLNKLKFLFLFFILLYLLLLLKEKAVGHIDALRCQTRNIYFG